MAERVCLLHWSEPEGAERARELAAFGYTVDHESRVDPSLLRSLADSPPAAMVCAVDETWSGLLFRRRR